MGKISEEDMKKLSDEDIWLLEEGRRLTVYVNKLPLKQRKLVAKVMLKHGHMEMKELTKERLIEVWNIIKEIEASCKEG